MLARIAAAIRRVLMAPFHLTDWLLSSIFGGGGGAPSVPPEFQPELTASSLADTWTAARARTSAEHTLHRDAVEVVQRYLSASPAARSMMDLSPLCTPLQDTLIGMSSDELALLRTARLSALRRFVDGEDHGLEGVPRVQLASATVIPFPMPTEREATSVEERMRLKIRAELGTTSAPFTPLKAVVK